MPLNCQTEQWVKNLSNREPTQVKEDMLAKGLNFAVEVPVVDLILATEIAIRNGKLPEAEAN